MREIKFRCWDKKNKEFVPYFELTCNGSIFFGSEEQSDKDFDIQQFTGLLDKNGKECFEGDLVKLLDYDKQLEVYFCEDCASFRAKLNGYGNNESLSNEFEVIGNIYENPNLIKTL
ncbi:YopX family protein [bacterium]|nr:YopX family protein [bacterium]